MQAHDAHMVHRHGERLTLPAGDLVRLRAGLLRVGVLRLCLSLGGEATRRRGGERGKRARGDTGLQTKTYPDFFLFSVLYSMSCTACMGDAA